MRGLPYKISWFLREVLFVFKNGVLFFITSLKKFAVFVKNAVVSGSKAIYRAIVAVLNYLHQGYLFLEGIIIGAGVYLWNLFLATKLLWLFASPYAFVPWLVEVVPSWRIYLTGALSVYSVFLAAAIFYAAFKFFRNLKVVNSNTKAAIELETHASEQLISKLRIPFRILIGLLSAILYGTIFGQTGGEGFNNYLSLKNYLSQIPKEHASLEKGSNAGGEHVDANQETQSVKIAKADSLVNAGEIIAVKKSTTIGGYNGHSFGNDDAGSKGSNKKASVVTSVSSINRHASKDVQEVDSTTYSEISNQDKAAIYASRKIHFGSACDTEVNVAVRYYSHDEKSWITSGWLRVGRIGANSEIDFDIGRSDEILLLYAYSGKLWWKTYWRGKKDEDVRGLVVMGNNFSYRDGNYPENQEMAEIIFTEIGANPDGDFSLLFGCGTSEGGRGISFLPDELVREKFQKYRNRISNTHPIPLLIAPSLRSPP